MASFTYPVNYVVSTPPASEPVSLSEAKEHLRVTDTSEDTLITALIQAAREWCETYERRAYVEQTITCHFDSFGSKMLLPVNPVLSITSITYVDSDGTTQTLDTSLYSVDTYSTPAYVYPVYGASMPSVRGDVNSITVTYKAGYSTQTERVKAAVKLLVAHLFENRQAAISTTLSEIPLGVKSLLCERVYY